MASAQSAFLRGVPGLTTPEAPRTSFTPATFTPPAIPAAPTLPVQNAANMPRESFLRDLLDPTKPTYLGNQARPALLDAGRTLKTGLEGYGDYTFTEDAQGVVTPDKQAASQPGSKYRDAYQSARATAAAAGMLYSRTADQLVGDAWHRLGDQERAVISQYAGTVSSVITGLAGQFTSVTNEIFSLYGEDVRYALENPIIAPDAPPAAVAAAQAAPHTAEAMPAKRAGAGSLPGKAAPQTYAQWLRAKGLTSSKTNAARWRAATGG